jgi:hypothetical protein
MFERLKQALVESFVGAIALGWLLAQGIVHFAGIFEAPVAGMIVRRQYFQIPGLTAAAGGISLTDALPELVRAFVLLLVWYVLFRWLYFTPVNKVTPESTPNPEQAV